MNLRERSLRDLEIEERRGREENLISERKTMEGLCTEAKALRARTALGWDNPRQIHTMIFMGRWGADLGSPPRL